MKFSEIKRPLSRFRFPCREKISSRWSLIFLLVLLLLLPVGCTDGTTEPPLEDPFDMSGNWDVWYAMGDTTLSGHMYIREEQGMLSGAQWTGFPSFMIREGERRGRVFWLHTLRESPPGDTLIWDIAGRLSFNGEHVDGNVWVRRNGGFEVGQNIHMYGVRGADSIANVVLGKTLL